MRPGPASAGIRRCTSSNRRGMRGSRAMPSIASAILWRPGHPSGGVAPPTARAPTPVRPDLAQQLTTFQDPLPGSRGATYLQQRGIPLTLTQQCGVGYSASGTWPHPAHDWCGSCQFFAPYRRTVTGAKSALKCTPTRSTFLSKVNKRKGDVSIQLIV